MRSFRRNGPPKAREVYSIYADAKKEAYMARGKGRRKELLAKAEEIRTEANKLDPEEWRYTGVITIDQLAELIGVDTYDTVYERNNDFIWETAYTNYDGDADSDEFMERQHEVENDEVFKPWHNGVESAAEKMFEDHNMALVPVKLPKGSPKDARPYQYRIKPAVGDAWTGAATAIVDTINGVGYFHIASVKELRESGPYNSTREAVLAHLGSMKDRPEVYGDYSYRSVYERNSR